jgi:ubiquinone biosynthesis protein UbiJ
MRRHSRLVLPVLATLSLGLAACGGGEGPSTAVLEDNLEAQADAVDALRTRVAELSDEVREVTSLDPMTGLSDLTDRLDELATRMEEVESTVAEQGGQEDVTAVVAAEVGKFGEQVDELVADVRDLTTVVQQVRDQLEGLETRFQEHADDPFAHTGPPEGQ